METIHSELSKDIKFEEIRSWKGLQIVARKLDQKSGKVQNSQNLEKK